MWENTAPESRGQPARGVEEEGHCTGHREAELLEMEGL